MAEYLNPSFILTYSKIWERYYLKWFDITMTHWFANHIDSDIWRILHWTNSMILNQFYKYCRGERNKKIQMSVVYFCVILRVGAWHSALYIKHNNNKRSVSYYAEKVVWVRVDNILKKWLPYWYNITILFWSLENHGIIRQCQNVKL